jgi:hypothetical protein
MFEFENEDTILCHPSSLYLSIKFAHVASAIPAETLVTSIFVLSKFHRLRYPEMKIRDLRMGTLTVRLAE